MLMFVWIFFNFIEYLYCHAVLKVVWCVLMFSAFYIFWQDWDRQNPTQIVTEMCGFVTILSGTFLLHKTKDMVDGTYHLWCKYACLCGALFFLYYSLNSDSLPYRPTHTRTPAKTCRRRWLFIWRHSSQVSGFISDAIKICSGVASKHLVLQSPIIMRIYCIVTILHSF